MKFTASNGMTVKLGAGSPPRVVGRGWSAQLLEPDEVALREFFRHERDEELGRWRWPEDPDYVVYPYDDHVCVLYEKTGESWLVQPKGNLPDLPATNAMRAYYAAHRPAWYDAEEGEVWIIEDPDEGTIPTIYQAGAFRDHGGYWMAEDISFAERVWPESREGS